MESRQAISSLFSRLDGWTGPSVETLGDLVLEGNMYIDHEGANRERSFYLFEKALVVIMAERVGRGLQVLRVVEAIGWGLPVTQSAPGVVNVYEDGKFIGFDMMRCN